MASWKSLSASRSCSAWSAVVRALSIFLATLSAWLCSSGRGPGLARTDSARPSVASSPARKRAAGRRAGE